MKDNREAFNFDKMVEKLDGILENYGKDIPTQVNLNLPKLKKVDKKQVELPKLKLPKLKKVTA